VAGNCVRFYYRLQLKNIYGYTTLDAIDPSVGMLSKAEEKRVYRNIYAGKVGDGESIPTDDGKYNAILLPELSLSLGALVAQW